MLVLWTSICLIDTILILKKKMKKKEIDYRFMAVGLVLITDPVAGDFH